MRWEKGKLLNVADPLIRTSSRIQELGVSGKNISDKITDAAMKKNLQGIKTISTRNSFVVLDDDDDDITKRALEMGIDVSRIDLKNVLFLI